MHKQLSRPRHPLDGDHEEILRRWREATDSRDREILHVILKALSGLNSLEAIGRECGWSRSTVSRWVTAYRRDGIDALLSNEKVGRRMPPNWFLEELQNGLLAERWETTDEACQWAMNRLGKGYPQETVELWVRQLWSS